MTAITPDVDVFTEHLIDCRPDNPDLLGLQRLAEEMWPDFAVYITDRRRDKAVPALRMSEYYSLERGCLKRAPKKVLDMVMSGELPRVNPNNPTNPMAW